MVVAPDGKRKATLDFVIGVGAGNFQCTARKHGLLRVVESDCPELLPVADQLVFDNDFVDGKLALELLN